MTERNRGCHQLGIRDLVSPNDAGAYRGLCLHPFCESVGILGADLILPLAREPSTVRHLGGGHSLTPCRPAGVVSLICLVLDAFTYPKSHGWSDSEDRPSLRSMGGFRRDDCRVIVHL